LRQGGHDGENGGADLGQFAVKKGRHEVWVSKSTG